MSLINDALKKADEAQKSGGAPPPPPIPMSPAKSGRSSFMPIFMLIVFLLGVLGLAAWFLSSWWKMNRERLLAKTVVESTAHEEPLDTNPPVVIPPQPTNEIKEPLVATNVVTVTNYVNVKADALALTNITKTLASLRLQGVFYRPPNSTALINGKSVHIGEKLQNVTVVDIGKDTVTVTLSGVTNVLELK
jgi:hypothetical protein